MEITRKLAYLDYCAGWRGEHSLPKIHNHKQTYTGVCGPKFTLSMRTKKPQVEILF